MSTAVEIIESKREISPMIRALIDDAADFSSKIESEKIIPFEFPRKTIVPLTLVFLFLVGVYFIPVSVENKPDPALLELLSSQAEELSDYSDEIKKIDKYNKLDITEDLGDDLTDLAEKLKSGEMSKKDALLEISDLEKKWEDMKKDLASSEKSLENFSKDLSKEAGKDSPLNNMLKDLAKKAKEGALSEKEKNSLADKLEEAAENLSDNNPLKKDLEDLANALREGNEQEISDKMKEIASKMENLAENKELLEEALSKMNKCQKELANQPGEKMMEDLASMPGDGEMAIDPFSKNPTIVPVKAVSGGEECETDFGEGSTNEQQQGKPLENKPVIDRQGEEESEKIEQFVKFYEEERAEFEKGSTSVTGEMGEGESTGSIPTTGAPTNIEKAEKSYEEIYIEYRNDAENAINEQKIPKGYKNLIRKYFDKIEPED